ncbi:ATP-binding protein [Flavobacteriaceae bacterium S356]|uniref:Oxygen sensor histidine kinase NreB n=1 Tax=Asprobacillus argus TaxID=3076534 RepID=A0ABU3LEY7_9FLAO|nr:ATP-binding protein [Flavobacteriaceae bacterium S356]
MREITKLFFALVILIYSSAVECSNKEVVSYTTSSLIIHSQVKDSLLLEKFRKADSLFLVKDYPKAVEVTTELLYQAKKEKNIELQSLANYLMAQIWYKTKAYKKSAKYFRKSLSSFSRNRMNNTLLKELKVEDNDFLFLENNFKLGVTYHRLLERNDSIIKFQDSALYYYGKVIDSETFKRKALKLQSKTYSNLSSIYMHDSMFDTAELYANKSIQIESDFSKNFYDLAGAYGNLAGIYLYESDYEKSKQTTLKALNFLDNIKGEKADRYKADLYFNLAYAMYMLRDYKAYEFQEKSYNIFDKLRGDELRKIVEKANAEKNFEIGMKEGILQEEIKLLEQKDKTWGVTVLSISILIILIGTIAYFKFRQKNLSLKVSRNELIQQQKIEKLKSESQIRILNATIDGKESERKQIAETLHDSVSTLLSSANLHLQACRSQFNGSTPVEIEKSQKIITEASDKIRDLSHTLVSSVLLKFGLQYSLKDMADKYSNSQIEIRTDISDLRRYDQGFEIKTYNIIQEFINNVLKHSKASKAELTLFEKDQRLMLSINDNGQGFNKDLIPEKDGLGINQIDARIKMMQGKFTIESSKGNGTKISVELPIHEREAVTFA